MKNLKLNINFLKAVIEGGVETKPENILIYATSNRRHLIKENWSDRNDVVQENGMHQSSTSIKNRENRISLIVTVHGRFFNSYRNFESSVKRIDSVKKCVL